MVGTLNNSRPFGSLNRNWYKWNVVMYDKTTEQHISGKFSTIKELNQEWNMSLNADYVRRIMTKYRCDESMRNKENSFLARYGHIDITKIREQRITDS